MNWNDEKTLRETIYSIIEVQNDINLLHQSDPEYIDEKTELMKKRADLIEGLVGFVKSILEYNMRDTATLVRMIYNIKE